MRSPWTLLGISLLGLCASPVQAQATPPGLVSLDLDGQTAIVWPYSGSDLAGTPTGPVNLVFLGRSDPRNLRALLRSLDGDRTAFGFPNVFPFNCTWSDAIGANETAWSLADGWQGSVVQLQCGEYATLRFHLRLFRLGTFTLGNAHAELLIPGTSTHAGLSWEVAEALVKIDLVRGGWLTAPPAWTPPITPAPTYDTLDPRIFNSLPVPLRAAFGLPLANQSTPVPLPNDGRASLLRVAGELPPVGEILETTFDLPFGQIVPKPFCSAGPLDALRVDGSLRAHHVVETSDEGDYATHFKAAGVLFVTPVDPLSGTATGPAYEARVTEQYHAVLNDSLAIAENLKRQTLLSDPRQAFFETLRTGPAEHFERDVDCGSQ